MFPSNHSTEPKCSSKNRIAIYSGDPEGHPSSVICPSTRSGHDQVKIFSQNSLIGAGVEAHQSATSWTQNAEEQSLEPLDVWSLPWTGNHSNTGILIEFIAVQSGSYQMKWLELTPQAVANPTGSVIPLGKNTFKILNLIFQFYHNRNMNKKLKFGDNMHNLKTH